MTLNKKIEVHDNKTLVLRNVISKEITNMVFQEKNESDNDLIENAIVVSQIENQIRSKGAMPIGPLIQCMAPKGNDTDISLCLMMQADKVIKNADPGFESYEELVIRNCMYVRFEGSIDNLQLAYNKLQLVAYEKNVKLKGNIYTVYVKASDDGEMIVDVFMETIL